ncbi:MAG: hypothetical protein FD169_1194 [Bacillota bacterium]|nr:MAG: hypothetical protein FD169_1194 [Bacillota bacterium]MBS3950851.1 hypothetical protein [Peptococcaceae bacterium]
MSEILERMLANLAVEQQAMVQDDVEQVLKSIEEQEILTVDLNRFLGSKPILSDNQRQQLQQVAALVQLNQLLAQQSLAFSRRMLRLLGGEEAYGEDGNLTAPRAKSLRIDIRA